MDYSHQTPLSMGCPRQDYSDGLPFPSPGNLPDPEVESMSTAWQADFLPLSHQESLRGVIQSIKKSLFEDMKWLKISAELRG